MTCRHGPYDPNCGSYQSNIDELKINYAQQIIGQMTPDAANFEIEDHIQLNGHLVLKVKYPNCVKCAYEGSKVMVFKDCTVGDALHWRLIDPHFREDIPNRMAREATAPIARFPSTLEGWSNAKDFALRLRTGGAP